MSSGFTKLSCNYKTQSNSEDVSKPMTNNNADGKILGRAISGGVTAGLVFFPFSSAFADSLSFLPTLGESGIWRYFLSGGLCCAFSHGVAVPFDVVKTRLQVAPEVYGGKMNAIGVFQKIVKEEGPGMLLKGFGPTIIGYTIQGALKYGFYEVFKPVLSPLLESTGLDISTIQGKLLLFGLAGAMADTIGSLALSPFESARIRLVASPNFANGLIDTLSKIAKDEGLTSLYTGLPAILVKQVPYTTVQLSVFEFLSSQIYSQLITNGMTTATILPYKFLITLSSAFVAAVLAAVASQPGDTLLSRINQCMEWVWVCLNNLLGMVAVTEKMQLRRSLIELEDQNVQNSIEISKRQLVLVQCGMTSLQQLENFDPQQIDSNSPLLAGAPEEIKDVWKETESLKKAIGKNSVVKKNITKRIRRNEKDAEQIRSEISQKVAGEDRRDLMELQYQVGRLELEKMELEQHTIVHESIVKGKDLTIQKLKLQLALKDKLIARQKFILTKNNLDTQ
eukprot:gene2644-5192_t